MILLLSINTRIIGPNRNGYVRWGDSIGPLEDHFQVENSTARETDRLRRSRQIFTARPALS